jgi:putative transposase
MTTQSNKHPAHGILLMEGQPTVIFDTICTRHKMNWLANSEVHQQLIETWTKADLWLVGRYVIMPNHIHLFAWATENANEYENWVRYWKSFFTKLHKVAAHRWQTDHWDTRIRNAAALEEKWNYIKQNPQRDGLVSNENDWPFQGEVFQLRWP